MSVLPMVPATIVGAGSSALLLAMRRRLGKRAATAVRCVLTLPPESWPKPGPLEPGDKRFRIVALAVPMPGRAWPGSMSDAMFLPSKRTS